MGDSQWDGMEAEYTYCPDDFDEPSYQLDDDRNCEDSFPENSSETRNFRNFRDNSDVCTAGSETGNTTLLNLKTDLEDQSAKSKEEEEEKEDGCNAVIRSQKKKSTKRRKEKEEGRKSFADVISGSIQKLFGRSSAYEEKDADRLESDADNAESCKQPSEANDDDDGDYDDDDDDEEAMWSDSEFDDVVETEYDNSVYSNVTQLGEIVDSDVGAEKDKATAVTTTTTTKPTTEVTKATMRTTNDLIIFDSEEKKQRNADKTEISRKPNHFLSVTESDGKSISQEFSRTGEIGSRSSKSFISDKFSSDVDRSSQAKEAAPTMQSNRQINAANGDNKVQGLKFSENRSKIQILLSKDEATSDSKREKHESAKHDNSACPTNKKIGCNKTPLTHEHKGNYQTQQDLKTTARPTAPNSVQNHLRTTNPNNPFVKKISNSNSWVKTQSSNCVEDSSSKNASCPVDEDRIPAPAVHSLVKLFETETTRRPTDQNNPNKGHSEKEGGIQKRPALRKKPVVQLSSQLNSPRKFTTARMEFQPPPLFPRRGATPAKHSSTNPDPPFPPRNRPVRSPDDLSSEVNELYLTPQEDNGAPPTAIATAILCTPFEFNESTSTKDDRGKRRLVKAATQSLPPLPIENPKTDSRMGSKGKSEKNNEPPNVPRTGPPPLPTRSSSTSTSKQFENTPPVPRPPRAISTGDIPTPGLKMFQSGEPLKIPRKASEPAFCTSDQDPPTDKSSFRPEVPSKPSRSSTNVTHGNAFSTTNDLPNGYSDVAPTTDVQLEQQPWYFGEITREKCDERLKTVGQNGAFLVRRSRFGGRKCPYTLSFYLNEDTVSLSIRLRPDNTYALGTEKPDETVYNDIMELVNFHRLNPIKLHNGQMIKLVTSPKK